MSLKLITFFQGKGKRMADICKYRLWSPNSSGGARDLVEVKNEEDGLSRIQALLAEWLRMENVVVLTAAGCSVESGGKLMAGQEDESLEMAVLEVVKKCKISKEVEAVIEQRKQEKSGKVSFEKWLSYLFNAIGLTEDEDTPIDSVLWKNDLKLSQEDGCKLRKYIAKAIYNECALELASEDSAHIPFLAKLIARDTNLGRTHLFTLNYDTLFEQALEELGIQYFDGFSGRANARFDPAVYGLDIYYPGDVSEGRVRRFDKFLQFYKLHGSIHWFVDKEGIYRARHEDLSSAEKYREKDVEGKVEKLQSDAPNDAKPLGILPTSQKFTQTLDMPYAHLFRLFHARLNQPQTFLLVLGYGFGDDHVTRIIETALMNPSLVMLVVEPNPNSNIIEKIKSYQDLGKRAFVLTERLDKKECSYEVATFSDFAKNVMPDVKWLEDFKRLRKFEKVIKEGGGNKEGEGD